MSKGQRKPAVLAFLDLEAKEGAGSESEGLFLNIQIKFYFDIYFDTIWEEIRSDWNLYDPQHPKRLRSYTWIETKFELLNDTISPPTMLDHQV